MSSINKNVDSFTVVRNLKKFMPEDQATALYGILGGKVDTLTTLPLAINVAFATALVPAISAAKARKDKKQLHKNIIFIIIINVDRITLYNRNDYICTTNFKFIISKCK